MKLNMYSSFSTLSILLISSSNIETRTPKKTITPATEESSNHWQNYGDNWSQWANNWSSGWSQDDKHATTHDATNNSKPVTRPSDKSKIVDSDSITLFGSKEMSSKQIKKNLTIYGAALLTDVHVGDVFTDYGRLKASSSSFNQLDAYGCTVLDKCTIHGDTKIYGLLDARSCTFESSLTAWATAMTLTHSKVLGDVFIKRDKGTKKQRIELVDTTIEGSITFEKNKGTVILIGTSCIKGEVIGGKVIHK